MYPAQSLPFFREIKKPAKILLAFLFLSHAFYSCDAKGSTEFSRKDALANLKKGDIGFILEMDLSRMSDIAKLDTSAPFYAGLLVESSGDKQRAARLYETALGSPIAKVKAEACRKLVPLLAELKDREQGGRVLSFLAKDKNSISEFDTLKKAALYSLGRYKEIDSLINGSASSQKEKPKAGGRQETGLSLGVVSEKAREELDSWNRALVFLSEVMQQKPGLITHTNLRSFLFDYPVDAAYRWAYEELLNSAGYVLPAAEKTAAAGRLAVLDRNYTSALLHFNNVRSSQASLFFRHTNLLSDLGRTYIASSRETGLKLFTDWESAIRTGKNSPIAQGVSSAEDRKALGAAEQNNIRYTLLFYAGRIRRQQGKHEDAIELFTRALTLAPDSVQKDACIWYILNSAFTEKPDTVPVLVRAYAGSWRKASDFYDILDRLSCYLVSQKKWGDIADVFSSIRNGKDGSIIAKYAYLTGRAVSLGYLSGRNLNSRDYFTIAYEEGNASFYYRALAASYLGKTIIPVRSTNQRAGKEQFPHINELEFYVKFFEFGASSHAMAYLRENADRYTNGELRTLAGTFSASGRFLESIQITGMYMKRDNYVMEKTDLKLYYPKPYTELIEKHARANGLNPSVFFGLIRTESAFTPAITSHAGAVGLAQIMPATGREIAASIKKRGGPDYAAGGAIDLTDPELNVQFGAVYLKDLTNSLGSQMLALLAYNGGPARISRLRRAAPALPEDLFIETITIAETRNYGKRVMAAAAAYGYLYYNMSMHDVVSGIFK